jgi:hypothetical protein
VLLIEARQSRESVGGIVSRLALPGIQESGYQFKERGDVEKET